MIDTQKNHTYSRNVEATPNGYRGALEEWHGTQRLSVGYGKDRESVMEAFKDVEYMYTTLKQ